MLKLNDDKTELVIIAPPYFLRHNEVPLSSVQVGDERVQYQHINVPVTSA